MELGYLFSDVLKPSSPRAWDSITLYPLFSLLVALHTYIIVRDALIDYLGDGKSRSLPTSLPAT